MGIRATRRGVRLVSRHIEDDYRRRHPPARTAFLTIKRTRGRRSPLKLMAAHEDRGPYLLVDAAGYGTAWRSPVTVHGRPTWIPVFERAQLAFELVESNDDLSPKRAKAIADKASAKVGPKGRAADAERLAWRLLETGR